MWPGVETAIAPESTASEAAAAPESARGRDFELAQRAGAGDAEAFEQLYTLHHRRVYCLCLRMTQNPPEAEDLAQEVFIQLFKKIGMFRGESAFTTWLHRLTVNQVLMHFRKKGVRVEQTTEDGEMPVQIVAGTEDPTRMPVVDRIALDNAIAQVAARLPRRLRPARRRRARARGDRADVGRARSAPPSRNCTRRG